MSPGETAALALSLRVAALIFAIICGANFQKASTENNVRTLVLGLILFLLAVASSGVSLALRATCT
jgi:hypothetical protein